MEETDTSPTGGEADPARRADDEQPSEPCQPGSVESEESPPEDLSGDGWVPV